jgi:hypoxanthine phosphoribosyltransferase
VPARELISEEELRAGVGRLGAEVSAAYPDGVVLVGVLKGSVLFFADLVRAITVPVEVDFLAISSYGEGTGRVRIVKDLDIDIHARPTLLVVDIVDTGLTLTYILFVLGYGLDFAERYRNLNRIVAGDLEALRVDPNAHVGELFSG